MIWAHGFVKSLVQENQREFSRFARLILELTLGCRQRNDKTDFHKARQLGVTGNDLEHQVRQALATRQAPNKNCRQAETSSVSLTTSGFSKRKLQPSDSFGIELGRLFLIKNACDCCQDGVLILTVDLKLNDRADNRAQKENGEDATGISHFFSDSQTNNRFGFQGQSNQPGGWTQMQSLLPRDDDLSLFHGA